MSLRLDLTCFDGAKVPSSPMDSSWLNLFEQIRSNDESIGKSLNCKK